MKIAFLTPEYPHASMSASGGIGTSIKTLAKGIVGEGHSVRIMVYGQKEDRLFWDDGVLVHQIKNIKIKGFSWYFTQKKIETIINQLHAKQELDLIEAPDWTGITSFINPRCPMVIRLHGSDTYFCYLDHRPVKWFNRFHEKRALQRATAHLSVSHYTAHLTNEIFKINKIFTVIPNSVDCMNFEKLTKIASKPKKILYFGTLIRKKGVLELPLIFNKVIDENPDVELYLVGRDTKDILSGTNSTWAMMKELFTIKALNQVTYFGGVPYEEVKKYIQEASICVFPTFAEALPVSWLEAMAMEKALVSSDIGWATEIIEDGVSGFLVHPKAHQEFANKIITLINDDNLMAQMGQSARKRVSNLFNHQKVIHQNLAFYQSLIQ